ncbi:MAG TPA: hypothetical protein DCW90_08760 [Lachnospiraceae bacterium]|nr:hypothetical protein [Lachnospiraceae bacterium]
MSQEQKTNCTIEYMTGLDRFAVAFTTLFTTALSIAIIGVLIAMGMQVAFIVSRDFNLLFCSDPSIKLCLYIALYIIIAIVGVIWATGLFFPSFNIFNRMVAGTLYKVSFYSGTTKIRTNYYTLKQVEEMGYQIRYQPGGTINDLVDEENKEDDDNENG